MFAGRRWSGRQIRLTKAEWVPDAPQMDWGGWCGRRLWSRSTWLVAEGAKDS